MTDSDLANNARATARLLTYNDDKPQAAAKHMLRELAHRLDQRCVRAKSVKGGLLLIDGLGRSRPATRRERWAYALAGSLPPKV